MRGTALSTSIFAILAALAAPAHAQSAPETDAPAAETEVQEIVVTGSRIARRDFQAASPIVTMDSSTVASTGKVTLEDGLNQLPQFAAGSGAYSSGVAATGQANLNLRGLGSSRNLVLLDGRRLQPSNAQQVVDVNVLPKSIIGDIEVISGGASAVYGSDAISGVVNFKLRRLDGVEITAQTNVTEHGGGGLRDVSIAAGKRFADDRLQVLAAASYSDRDELSVQDRDFFKTSRGVSSSIVDAFFNGGANAPSQAVVNALFGTYGVAPGAVVRTSGFGVNNDGTLFSTGLGVHNYRNNSPYVYNNGQALLQLPEYTYVQMPLERLSTFGKASYEITPDLTFFVQGLYTEYNAVTLGDPAPNAGWQPVVPVSNPFIPTALRTLLASRPSPNAPIRLTKRYAEAGPRATEHESRTYQVVVGLSGEIGETDISWDLSASRGDSRIDDELSGAVFASRIQQLVDAADGGRSICAGGYNPFVTTGGASPDCVAYFSGKARTKTSTAQDVIELNVQGPVMELPAGELRFAAGANYRKNSFAFTPDANYASGDVVGIPRTAPTRGSTKVVEGYGELFIPVIRDVTGIQDLSLGLAYRYSDYDRSGGVSTYKADLDWSIVPGLRVRGGYQRAIRAPNVGELFSGATGAFPTIGLLANGGGDPCDIRSTYRTGPNAAAVRAICLSQGMPDGLADSFVYNVAQVAAFTTGNLDLKPETADTYTLGAVLTPKLASPWLSRLSFSIDYYDIAIEDAIAVISTPTALNKCFNADGSNPTFDAGNIFCALILRDVATGGINNAQQPYLNLGGYRTRGVDLQADWSVRLSDIGLDDSDLRVSLSSVISYLDSFEVQQLPNTAFQDYAQTIGGGMAYPRWRANTTLTVGNEQVTALLRWRRIGEMDDVSTVTNAASTVPGVEAYDYFDASVQFTPSERYAIRVGVNNLADKTPPVVSGEAGATDAGTYDILGRTFYASVTARF